MDANMEELEKRMGFKIDAVRDMMLDRFSVVDQKLTAIGQLLIKIIEPQNQTGNPPDNLTDKNTGEEAKQSSKNQEKGKKVAVGGGDGGTSQESGPDKPLQAHISSDGDHQENDYQTRGQPGGRHIGDQSRHGPSHESGPDNPLEPQISSDGDHQETDNHTRGPPGGLHCGEQGRHGPSHESGPNIPLQAQISSNGDHQETEDQIRDPQGGLYLGDGGKQSPSHEYGSKKPVQAQFTLDGDGQKTDIQIGDPPGGFHFGDRGRHGPSHESGPNKPLQAQISSDGDDQETDNHIWGPPGGFYLGDGGRQGPPWEAGSSCGWVGLYTHRYGTYNPPGPDYSFGTDFCGPAWVGLHDFSKKNGPQFGSHESTFKGQPVNNDIERALNYSGEKFVKTGQDDIFKEGDNKSQAQVVTEGSNEKGHEQNQNCGSKRKHPDRPVGGPNDGPISNGPFTTSKQRVDMLTTDEQDIHLNEVEPIMKSIQRIMHYKGYNDGDPLSADDQTYILENVLNHHPEKAQKMGAGVDYIMVDKHMKFQGSRCFYIVSIDGRKEDFSYHKCLKNFTRKSG